MTEARPREVVLELTRFETRAERRLRWYARAGWLVLGISAVAMVTMPRWYGFVFVGFSFQMIASVRLARAGTRKICRAIDEDPESVTTIAWWRRGSIAVTLADRTRGLFAIEPARVEEIVDTLTTRCPKARVFAERAAPRARFLPLE